MRCPRPLEKVPLTLQNDEKIPRMSCPGMAQLLGPCEETLEGIASVRRVEALVMFLGFDLVTRRTPQEQLATSVLVDEVYLLKAYSHALGSPWGSGSRQNVGPDVE
jgi:hypothetical protein